MQLLQSCLKLENSTEIRGSIGVVCHRFSMSEKQQYCSYMNLNTSALIKAYLNKSKSFSAISFKSPLLELSESISEQGCVLLNSKYSRHYSLAKRLAYLS